MQKKLLPILPLFFTSIGLSAATNVLAQQTMTPATMAAKSFSGPERKEMKLELRRIMGTTGGIKAVCSSTDNKKSCACGDDPCIAGATTCGCIKVVPPASSE